jgi:hypothetical protein
MSRVPQMMALSPQAHQGPVDKGNIRVGLTSTLRESISLCLVSEPSKGLLPPSETSGPALALKVWLAHVLPGSIVPVESLGTGKTNSTLLSCLRNGEGKQG